MYARIVSGVVVETFNPPADLTPADCFHADIAAQFVTVPVGVVPDAGWTYAGGTFTAPASSPAPTLAQEAAAMLAAGIQIVSTSTPALDGTYPVDDATWSEMAGILAGLGAGLTVPGGGSTFNWPDAGGAPHAFTAAEFKALAQATMNFVYALDAIVKSNSGTLPTQPVTIA